MKIIFQKRNPYTREKGLQTLKDVLIDIFTSYSEGVEKYNEDIQGKYPDMMCRLDPMLLNYHISASMRKKFPSQFRIGKYGRLIFRWEGVQMIVKKVDKNGKPSYVKTKISDTITNQLQFELFKDESGIEEPILIFGYTKDSLGCVVNPRIIFYDDGVKWQILESDLNTTPISKDVSEDIEISVKVVAQQKQAE